MKRFQAVFLAVGFALAACSSSHSAEATPGPSAAPAGIQLYDGSVLGAAAFPDGDTPRGGQGAPVNGIACNTMEGAVLHIHAHVALFVNGKQLAIPRNIGIVGKCLYWVHTHDAEGIIHMESPKYRSFTLGDVFRIWGQPLSEKQVATYKGPAAFFVNGVRYNGNPNAILLTTHQQIVIEVGRHVPPPNYIFPPGD